MAAQGNLTGLVDEFIPMIAALGKLASESVEIEGIAGTQHEGGAVPSARRTNTDQGGGGAGKQQAGTGRGVGERHQGADATASGCGGRRRAIVGQHVPGRQGKNLGFRGHCIGESGNAGEAGGATEDGEHGTVALRLSEQP